MSFLQPWLLYGLPIIALPIIIHLINQRRFQTIQWAAMMFLLAAHRMARGYSRLRQWLILLFRTLAVAGLMFAISRPLASGWLGLAGGTRADTTIILLDRSPSMQQRGAGTGESKLETSRKQLVHALETIGSGRWVLIESARNEPHDLESPRALLNLPVAGPAGSAADLPLMLQAAHDYIRQNRTGRTEIWICSDLRENDWAADSGRWATLRDAFQELPQGVRIHLLAYPEPAPTNVAVRVTDVRRQDTTDGAEVVVSFRVSRPGIAETSGGEATSVPVQFEIDGARSVINVDLTGSFVDFKEHRIPIERSKERGWGRISVPADVNPADDDFYFAFEIAPPRKTIVVADDPQAERPLQLAAAISPDPSLECSADVVTTEQLSAVEWDQISTVLWQSSLPTGANADLLKSFVNRGGQLVVLPPRDPTSDELFGIRWQSWVTETNPLAVTSWRGDEDVLSRTLSGSALPVGQLEIRRYCQITGETTPLATLPGGQPLVARVPTEHGGVYCWTTTPSPGDSSLATSGVVLYAFIQRVLTAGSAVLKNARQVDAGVVSDVSPQAAWNRLSEADQSLSTESAWQRGVYGVGDRVLAVNRPAAEDVARSLPDARVAELFRGLNFVRVDDQAGSLSSLIQEIWRIFLVAMLIALVMEAILCLPKIGRTSSLSSPVPTNPAFSTGATP
jgi:hypothetical protein